MAYLSKAMRLVLLRTSVDYRKKHADEMRDLSDDLWQLHLAICSHSRHGRYMCVLNRLKMRRRRILMQAIRTILERKLSLRKARSCCG